MTRYLVYEISDRDVIVLAAMFVAHIVMAVAAALGVVDPAPAFAVYVAVDALGVIYNHTNGTVYDEDPTWQAAE